MKKEKSNFSKTYFKIILSVAIILALTYVILFLFQINKSIEFKILRTLVYILYLGFIGSRVIRIYDKTKYKTLAKITIILPVISFLLIIGLIWGILPYTSLTLARITLSFNVLTLSIVPLSYLLEIKEENKQTRISKIITISSILITNILVIYYLFTITIDKFYLSNDPLTRLISASLFINIVGLIITPQLNKIK